jgi:hypothetical protein
MTPNYTSMKKLIFNTNNFILIEFILILLWLIFNLFVAPHLLFAFPHVGIMGDISYNSMPIVQTNAILIFLFILYTAIFLIGRTLLYFKKEKKAFK